MQNVYAKIIDSDNHMKVIDKVHYEVHEGATFSNSVSTTVIAASTYFITYTLSTSYTAHFQFNVTAASAASIGLYDSPTVASTWAVTTSYNHYRASTRTAGMSVRNNVPSSDVTSTGTLIESYQLGSGTTVPTYIGGDLGNRTEWILSKGGTYLIKINSASTNTITFNSNWYEE